jgi:hypothetical protein
MATYPQKQIQYAVAGGSGTEALGGAAAAVLAILGLSGVFPAFMMSIAAIVLGVALLFQGGAVAAEYRRLMDASSEQGRVAQLELGGGLGIEVLAGGCALVLGILALLGLASTILVSVATIVIGTGVLLSSGVLTRLNDAKFAQAEHSLTYEKLSHEAVSTSAALQVLVGVSALVLGILSLIGVQPHLLNLVAELAVGSAIFLSGSAIAGRMLNLFGGA